MDPQTERIRERAYAIWLRENCPEGRADAHWEMAREEIAILDNQQSATLPNPAADGKAFADGSESAEPWTAAEESFPDVPGPANQGETKPYPKPRRRKGQPAARA